jgi:hypothetical protein
MKVNGAEQRATGFEPVVKHFGRLVVLVIAVYVAAWHLSFLSMCLIRSEAIDARLYGEYLVFMFKPELETPTFIQLWASVLTVLYFVIRWAFMVTRRALKRSTDDE